MAEMEAHVMGDSPEIGTHNHFSSQTSKKGFFFHFFSYGVVSFLLWDCIFSSVGVIT